MSARQRMRQWQVNTLVNEVYTSWGFKVLPEKKKKKKIYIYIHTQ